MTPNVTPSTTPMQDPDERRSLRGILRENIARMLYDSACLGDGPEFEQLEPAIAVAWHEDARAAQRLTDPIVRDALVEIIAADLAHDRGLDWPRLTNLGVSVDPSWDQERAQNRIELTRIEARQRFRHDARVALTATLRHLRSEGNDRHPHVDRDLVARAQAQQAEDEIRRMLLKPKPALRGIDGGKADV